jgi:protein TonB
MIFLASFQAAVLLLGAQSTAPAAPLGPPLNEGRGVTSGDSYPSGPMRRHEQGVVVIAFDVNADGRVENCTIKQSTGFPELDAWTCALYVHRARFTPNPDRDGIDRRTLSVQWRLPG